MMQGSGLRDEGRNRPQDRTTARPCDMYNRRYAALEETARLQDRTTARPCDMYYRRCATLEETCTTCKIPRSGTSSFHSSACMTCMTATEGSKPCALCFSSSPIPPFLLITPRAVCAMGIYYCRLLPNPLYNLSVISWF